MAALELLAAVSRDPVAGEAKASEMASVPPSAEPAGEDRPVAGDPPGVALVYPGLGSQRARIGLDLVEAYPAADYDWASEVLGYDVLELLATPDLESRENSYRAQVALFCVSVAATRVLTEAGLTPSYVAGHSLGESAALVASGALAADVGLAMVAHRAEVMREVLHATGRTGSMVAVLGLPFDRLYQALDDAAGEDVLVLANDNAPGNGVVAGKDTALDRLVELAEAAGAKRVLRMNVDCAFHSPLMAPVVETMRPYLSAVPLRPATVPMVLNSTTHPCRSVGQLRTALVEQLISPVRWRESVLRLAGLGVDTFIEVGPGSVLSGLIRRIVPDAHVMSAGTHRHLARTLDRLASRQPVR
jgi:[acyl-carrier-protein] S-malonyltransferase